MFSLLVTSSTKTSLIYQDSTCQNQFHVVYCRIEASISLEWQNISLFGWKHFMRFNRKFWTISPLIQERYCKYEYVKMMEIAWLCVWFVAYGDFIFQNSIIIVTPQFSTFSNFCFFKIIMVELESTARRRTLPRCSELTILLAPLPRSWDLSTMWHQKKSVDTLTPRNVASSTASERHDDCGGYRLLQLAPSSLQLRYVLPSSPESVMLDEVPSSLLVVMPRNHGDQLGT